MRSIEELVQVAEPAWPVIQTWITEGQAGGRNATVLPGTEDEGRACLHRLQVSAGSVLGAVALHTAGILVDHGWLRLLGGAGSGLVDLVAANQSELGGPIPTGLFLVAVDVVGGRYVMNGGGLPGRVGDIQYWAPDTLDWLDLESGYPDFLHWVLTDDFSGFYADLRWDGWINEVRSVGLDQALTFFPPLSTEESDPIEATTRSPIPLTELISYLS
jgi:hypothetical protein